MELCLLQPSLCLAKPPPEKSCFSKLEFKVGSGVVDWVSAKVFRLLGNSDMWQICHGNWSKARKILESLIAMFVGQYTCSMRPETGERGKQTSSSGVNGSEVSHPLHLMGD